jgi:hypothetical protein
MGKSFNLVSGGHSIFVSDSVWLGRFRTDDDSLYGEGVWKELPEEIASMKFRDVTLGWGEVKGDYIINETLVQPGDSVSLFTYLDENKIVDQDKRKMLFIGGYNTITSRLKDKLAASRQGVKEQAIILTIATLFFLQGIVVYLVERRQRTN